MKRRTIPLSQTFFAYLGLLAVAAVPLRAEPSAAAVSAFYSYVASIESRLTRQHQSRQAFLAGSVLSPQNRQRLRSGELIVEQIAPASAQDFHGAMLHHWRGTAFAPGARPADFERLMRDFDDYPRRFAPQVLQARVLARQDDHFTAAMRIRQQHVLTVVMDTTYDVVFGRLDAQHGYSVSRSTGIKEIDAPGTAKERALSPEEEHGFLWRLNTYWSYEEHDGGLYLQIESVSLTRAIPTGLGWAVRPFVESVPRESLEFTLRSTCNALKQETRNEPQP
ncbi:MAG TPA: hypothetical protein VG225_02540 [Terracidiphilus sp.]|jgi:hypothetical protein|nr:hypothetical protein [Terracidiphilus sp.]